MATSLRDLLERARLEADHAPVTIATAQDAITALGHLARALHTLGDDGRQRRGAEPGQLALTWALAEAAATAAAGWAPTSGRLPDLAGAAADVLGRLTPQLDAAGRWAAAVALAETARHCLDTAQQPQTYRHLAPLTQARAAAAALEQHATADPPTTVSRMVLDRLIPPSSLDPASSAPQRSLDATAGLIAAVRAVVSRRELSVGEAIAATTVARFAATHAAEFAGQLSRNGAPPPDWQAAPAAWRAVQLSYASIDDGTKPTPPPDPAVTDPTVTDPTVMDSTVVGSAVIAWAVRLHDSLHAHFAAPPPLPHPIAWPAGAAPRVGPGSGHERDLAQSATVLRAVTNSLPELARLLEHAADTWTQDRAVYAPLRRLPSFEHHNLTAPTSLTAPSSPMPPATAADRIVAVQPGDLADTITALRDAERLSTSLSAELDHTSRVHGHQPQPYLAAAHQAATAQATTLARTRRAQAATRRAAATQPGEWTLPSRPPGPARGR